MVPLQVRLWPQNRLTFLGGLAEGLWFSVAMGLCSSNCMVLHSVSNILWHNLNNECSVMFGQLDDPESVFGFRGEDQIWSGDRVRTI